MLSSQGGATLAVAIDSRILPTLSDSCFSRRRVAKGTKVDYSKNTCAIKRTLAPALGAK